MNAEPPDSAELDALAELERSPGWDLVKARVEWMLEKFRAALELPADVEKTAGLRGKIDACRQVLSVPSVLKGEIKNALETHGRP